MSRTLLKRAIDAQTRYERAELAAADKRTLRDKAIRDARAEHPAAHIAQATGLSRERVRQITKLTLALVAVLALAGCGTVVRVTIPTPTAPRHTASTDCNDLPASASRNLSEVRESRCEMEKLDAENPSAASEREIETMISSEHAIEASE